MDQNAIRNQYKNKTNSSNNSKNNEKFPKKDKKENSIGKLNQNNNKFTVKAVPEKQISLYTLIEKNDKCNSSISTNTSKENKLNYGKDINDNISDKEKLERGNSKVNTLISNNDSLNSSKSSDIYKQSSFISNNENSSIEKKEFKDEYHKGNKMIYSTIPKVIITSKQFMNLNNNSGNVTNLSSNISQNMNSNSNNESRIDSNNYQNIKQNTGKNNFLYSDSCKSSVHSKNTISANSFEKIEKNKYNNRQTSENNSERKIQTGDFKLKYKTEKCKYWDLYKNCKFGENCAFAHGNNELNDKYSLNPNYKTKKCAQFHETGYCPYGIRCQFLHKSVLSDNNKTNNLLNSPDSKFCGKSIMNKKVCYSNLINTLINTLEVDNKLLTNNLNDINTNNIILSNDNKSIGCNEKKSNRLKVFTEISNDNNSHYVKKRSRANTDHGDWCKKLEYKNNQEFNIHESENYNNFLDLNNFEENNDNCNNINSKTLKLTNKMSVTKEVDLELEQKYSNILDEEYEREVNTNINKNKGFNEEYFDNYGKNEFNSDYKKLKELNNNLKIRNSNSNKEQELNLSDEENSSKSFNSKIFFDENIMFENDENDKNDN